MANKQETIEEKAATVEEAVAAGLARLKLPQDKVDVEVVDEGRRGLLGIGGRDAVVRLRVRVETATKLAESAKPQASEAPARPPEMSEKPAKTTSASASAESKEEKPADTARKKSEAAPIESDEDRAEATSAKAIIEELLDKMDVPADVEVGLSEPDDLTGRRLTMVNVTGDQLGLLIGPRGETLDAMQHLTRLMVGHQVRHRANFVLDIDGYREKREQALARLAERMGQKALDRGSPITLEPMPAYERRIIHITLRENPQVRTESTGEGSRRRVRIYPL